MSTEELEKLSAMLGADVETIKAMSKEDLEIILQSMNSGVSEMPSVDVAGATAEVATEETAKAAEKIAETVTREQKMSVIAEAFSEAGLNFETLPPDEFDMYFNAARQQLGEEKYNKLIGGAEAKFGGKETVAGASKGFKQFEDYCPHIMENEATRKWIEKEGDKARVFAVKMQGILDNPNMSSGLKKVLSTPEGMVSMYNQINAISSDPAWLATVDMNNVDEFAKFQASATLVQNDAVVLSEKHWEQCYSMTSTIKANGDVVPLLTSEAEKYEEQRLGRVTKATMAEAEKSMAKLEERLPNTGGVYLLLLD